MVNTLQLGFLALATLDKTLLATFWEMYITLVYRHELAAELEFGTKLLSSTYASRYMRSGCSVEIPPRVFCVHIAWYLQYKALTSVLGLEWHK